MQQVISNINTRSIILLALMLTLLSQPVLAADIFGPAMITASTTMPNSGAGFTIDQISDGIIDPPVWFNGFAAQPGIVGTIRLDLTTEADLPRKHCPASANLGTGTASQKAKVQGPRTSLLGCFKPLLGWMEESATPSETRNRYQLAPQKLASVLALEKQTHGLWPTQPSLRGHQSHKKNVSRKSALGCATNSW